MPKRVLIVITAALMIAVVPRAAGQHLAAVQQTRISVQVVPMLGVHVPDLPTPCADCVMKVPLSWNWNLAPSAALGTTFLVQLRDFDSTPRARSTTRYAVAKGMGWSHALVDLAPNGDSGRTIVTIELQHY